MTPTQRDLLQKARDSLDASELLLKGGHPGFAASRAYYSMFYVAEALLLGLGLSFSKHSAVVAAFGQHLCRTGKVPTHFHRYLIEAMAFRHADDYSPRPSISGKQASEQIRKAGELLVFAEKELGKGNDQGKS